MTTLLIIATILILLIILLLIPGRTPAIKSSSGKSISKLEKIVLGGDEQWILQRSENTDNPVILFLHGGPGTSDLGLNRRNRRGLEKDFIVVNWDQRGAGKSYRAGRDASKMNLEQFISDTRELTLWLMKKFGKEKIVLAGHSWGSAIGALTAYRYPELYYCYVGIGQIGNMVEGETRSYEWCLEQASERKNRKAVRTLEKIGKPPYKGNMRSATITERSFVSRYGGEVHGSSTGAFGYVIPTILFSWEYSLRDKLCFFPGILRSMKLLWPQLMNVDLFTMAPEFKVPVLFMEGRHDHEVPSEVAVRYFESLKAPYKELLWFENSAHMMASEEKELFNKVLAGKVISLTKK